MNTTQRLLLCCAALLLFSYNAAQASSSICEVKGAPVHSGDGSWDTARVDRVVSVDSVLTESDSTIAEGAHRVYPATRRTLQMEAGAAYSYLDNNAFTPWEKAYVEAAYPFGDRKTVYGHLEYLHQYDLNDGDVFAGVYYPILKNLTAVAEGEFGFAHKITPLWSLFGQLEYKLFPGFVLGAGLRNSEYRDAADNPNEVQLFNITAEYWFSYFRAMYTFYESRGNGGVWNPPSHLVEFGYYYGDANNISIGASMGHEVDRISQGGAPLLLNVYDTRTVFFLGRHWLNPDWGLSYELGWHQENHASATLYNRYEIRLGIRHRF